MPDKDWFPDHSRSKVQCISTKLFRVSIFLFIFIFILVVRGLVGSVKTPL